ncbi:hypothetical protein MFUL124B02_26455 [Myxococcus fulvus 124B02]|nr:hypothetical protein MFUL124B02_26455 [Myxococcus fulvus 124B02]
MSPADIKTVASTATAFINDYLIKHGHFTPAEEVDTDEPGSLRFSFYRTMPDQTSPGPLVYTFVYGSKYREKSPELQQWVRQIMTALQEAHPEVSQFKSAIELDPAAD